MSAVPACLDVLIVGAGLSGLGVAYYLQRDHPAKSWAILEARAAIGGTWDLFRYPGIRSDSDLHTFGYAFKPWVHEQSIAGAEDILAYLREMAAENGIESKVHLQHRVRGAAWSSADAKWTVDIERLDSGELLQISCRWLFCAAGYYRYDQGYTPQFEGRENFQGQLLHPQHWPEKLDYAGKRVLVIGSGATAVTLVPAMAEQAAHVTMLQRTPSYVLSLPSVDAVANALRKVLPGTWAYAITRRKNIALARAIWRLCRKYPRAARRLIRFMNQRVLPKGYPVDEHFNPPYKPWEQRLCIVPDGDLFKAISAGKVSVVTDHIARFTAQGVQLTSGRALPADIVVTATGLNLQLLGGMRLCVDGERVDISRKVAFKGMMLDGIPNFAFAIGYVNASWTLKVGLLCEHFCRLLSHMDQNNYAICRAELPSPEMPTRPILDLGSGYVQRALRQMPRQGLGVPWRMALDYQHDVKLLREGPVQDPCLRFTTARHEADPFHDVRLSKEPTMTSSPRIVPRENLDFGLQGIPRYWLGGDPFKTRFFDAMSITFPEGERYFISCVRDFRDAVTDPTLKQQIKDFIRQEGQHGIIHNQFNKSLRAQGVDVDRYEGMTRSLLFGFMRRFLPKKHTLATTAACEHLTAIMAQAFFVRNGAMATADPRMHAMYTWHAMEEMEHKAVAFDVMQKVAKVGYLRRVYALCEATLSFNLQIILYTFFMLKSDGFSRLQRLKMMAAGLWWVYGPRGIFMRHLKLYLRYYKPGFHPWHVGEAPWYRLWLETFNRTGDPIEAGRSVFAAAGGAK